MVQIIFAGAREEVFRQGFSGPLRDIIDQWIIQNPNIPHDFRRLLVIQNTGGKCFNNKGPLILTSPVSPGEVEGNDGKCLSFTQSRFNEILQRMQKEI